MGVIEAYLQPLVEQPHAVIDRDQCSHPALRVGNPIYVEMIGPVVALGPAASVDGRFESHRATGIARSGTSFRSPLSLLHGLTSGDGDARCRVFWFVLHAL